MNVWGIADLHLSFARPKPMDVFGAHWADHAAHVAASWQESVRDEDVVCLPGDLSWGMRLAEVEEELRWLGGLPGRKVLIKGNHDYWWSSLTKVRTVLPPGVFALQNDAVTVDGVSLAGARGWVDPALDFRGLLPQLPGQDFLPQHDIRGGAEDRKIYDRELERLEASLRGLDGDAKLRIALLHFPPTSPALEETPVTRLLERYRVDIVVFGHLHGTGGETFTNPYGTRSGIVYYLVSADFAGFRPVRLARV